MLSYYEQDWICQSKNSRRRPFVTEISPLKMQGVNVEMCCFNDNKHCSMVTNRLFKKQIRKKWRYDGCYFSKRPPNEQGQPVSKINIGHSVLILDTCCPFSVCGLLEKWFWLCLHFFRLVSWTSCLLPCFSVCLSLKPYISSWPLHW